MYPMKGLLVNKGDNMEIINKLCNIDNGCLSLKYPIDKFNFSGIITCNGFMIKQIEHINRISDLDVNILIYGETGTGKEVYAEYIHKVSHRKDNRFVKLNGATIPDQLFESEMFGYIDGAFTGASRYGKKGLLELANKGTIFLDEIGEMPLETQSKLLHVIQDKSFIKLGSQNETYVDVKIISATNKNLREMIGEKKFREDLYYRLNVFPIYLIPLRERKEDIVLLSLYFLNDFNLKHGYDKKLNYDTMINFLNYDWPGNVRELKNSIERLVLLARNDIIANAVPVVEQYEHEFNLDNLNNIQKNITNEKDEIYELDENKSLKEMVDDYEIKIIKSAIKKYGSLRKAAKKLKASPSTLSRKLSIYENVNK